MLLALLSNHPSVLSALPPALIDYIEDLCLSRVLNAEKYLRIHKVMSVSRSLWHGVGI